MKPKNDNERAVEAFNRKYQPGTFCRFWRGTREGDGFVDKTRCAAFILGGHTPVVMFAQGGCIALTHVEPLADQQEPPHAE